MVSTFCAGNLSVAMFTLAVFKQTFTLERKKKNFGIVFPLSGAIITNEKLI